MGETTAEYWEGKYAKDMGEDFTPFDWFADYKQLRGELDKHCTAALKIIHVGSGTSTLPEELYTNGCKSQICFDVSASAVAIMQKRNGGKDGLVFQEKNVVTTKLEKHSADVIVDKALLDSLLTGLSGDAVAGYLLNISNALKSGGKYICITHGKPEHRHFLLAHARYGWTVAEASVPKRTHPNVQHDVADMPTSVFLYICTKK